MSDIKTAEELIKYLNDNKLDTVLFLALNSYWLSFDDDKENFDDCIYDLSESYKSNKNFDEIYEAWSKLGSMSFKVVNTERHDGKIYYTVLSNDKISIAFSNYYSSWGDYGDEPSDWFIVEKKEVMVEKWCKINSNEGCYV
jgi:hypothetical protein